MMIPFILPLVASGVGGYVIKTTVESGTWDEIGETIQDIGENVNLPDPLAGARDMVDKMAMLMIVSTLSIITLAVAFTVLYPKWK